MFKIKVISNFSAAHSLRGYKGKCESLHGHNWKIEAVVSGNELNHLGMVMDFSDLRKMLNSVLEKLDHKHLNELDYFTKVNPSSEEIARYIFNELRPLVIEGKCDLKEISVWETEGSCASYKE
ncbi:MAG: 6-carboxytetrahydropterin synthase QueD [Candidatus Omnitrophota bacterium]